MRILLVTDTLAPTYGWGRYSIDVIRALLRRGTEIVLLSPRALCQEDDLRVLPDHRTVTSFVSETRRLSRLTLANTPRIWRAARECDAIHCLTEPYAIPAALATMLPGAARPLLVSLHGTYAVRPFTRPGERLWYELAYRRAGRLLPVSRFTRSLLPSRFQTSKTHVVPNCVDATRFASASDIPAQAPANEKPFLLSVGPIKRRKGYHITIEAFARVHAAHPEVEYWIAGGTDDKLFLAGLTRRIGELGLQDSVKFLGRVSDSDLISLYQRCALFWLLPVSDDLQFEGFGLVYLEANAAGRPAIGARGSGAEDAIEDGVTGYLVDPTDPTAAADAASRLLRSPDLAATMGAEALRRTVPWDVAAGRLIEHYEAVCGETPGSSHARIAMPPAHSGMSGGQ